MLTGMTGISSHMQWPVTSQSHWPDQGLNPGLPNDTAALYPLLQEQGDQIVRIFNGRLFTFDIFFCCQAFPDSAISWQ
jgi:hypothetical protein